MKKLIRTLDMTPPRKPPIDRAVNTYAMASVVELVMMLRSSRDGPVHDSPRP